MRVCQFRHSDVGDRRVYPSPAMTHPARYGRPMADSFIPLLDPDELPPDLKAQWDANTRSGLRASLQLMGHAPEHLRRYNEVYGGLRFDNHLGPRLTELVRLAVAQTTQCQVCLAGRHPDALADGMTEDMVQAIGADERPGYSAQENAAVNYALKLSTDHHSITEAEITELTDLFTPEQVVELSLLIVMCMVGRFSKIAGLVEDDAACPAPASPAG